MQTKHSLKTAQGDLTLHCRVRPPTSELEQALKSAKSSLGLGWTCYLLWKLLRTAGESWDTAMQVRTWLLCHFLRFSASLVPPPASENLL